MAKLDYDIEIRTITKRPTTLAEYRGKVLLIVNTASKCGLTPQFEGLEALWKEFGNKNFAVLGFPSNQFGGQDPGTDDEIAEFCQLNYGVSFPMHSKIEVNGPGTHPLYRALKAALPGGNDDGGIEWNFAKFLVGKDGEILARYAPTSQPDDLASDIRNALES